MKKLLETFDLGWFVAGLLVGWLLFAPLEQATYVKLDDTAALAQQIARRDSVNKVLTLTIEQLRMSRDSVARKLAEVAAQEPKTRTVTRVVTRQRVDTVLLRRVDTVVVDSCCTGAVYEWSDKWAAVAARIAGCDSMSVGIAMREELYLRTIDRGDSTVVVAMSRNPYTYSAEPVQVVVPKRIEVPPPKVSRFKVSPALFAGVTWQGKPTVGIGIAVTLRKFKKHANN